jgi:hypothetical protein
MGSRRIGYRSTFVQLVLALVAATDVAAATPGPDHGKPPEPVGLSLFFRDGVIQPIDLVGDAPRFLQEIDITTSITTTTDQGIQPLIHSSQMSSLDWRGVYFVEEDFRDAGDGTFTRQRFYRGARWMENDSAFIAIPKDAHGHLAGDPLVFLAGTDDKWRPSDDGFVRRYDARQITLGCVSMTDCTGATQFIAQGLVQSRQEQHVGLRQAKISSDATQMQLIWSGDPRTDRTVALTHSPTSAFPYGYGFQPEVQILTQPANGAFYLPGDDINFRVVFKDGAGNRLTPEGSLPTYGEFQAGTAAGGLHYFDPALSPTLYYALKHREGNMLLSLSGPTSKLISPVNTVPLSEFFGPELHVASVPVDGWTGVAAIFPPFPQIVVPALWGLPVSDIATLNLPADAEPGTYVVALKARRDWGGEALNRGTTLTVQVGSRTPTVYTPTTGHCDNCHQDRSSLSIVNHGIADRSSCVSCHASIFNEPDNVLDVRVHFVHSRSNRFPGNVNNCSTCHLTQPMGPPRGFPGVGF